MNQKLTAAAAALSLAVLAGCGTGPDPDDDLAPIDRAEVSWAVTERDAEAWLVETKTATAVPAGTALQYYDTGNWDVGGAFVRLPGHPDEGAVMPFWAFLPEGD